MLSFIREKVKFVKQSNKNFMLASNFQLMIYKYLFMKIVKYT